jgi:hypothetical protein
MEELVFERLVRDLPPLLSMSGLFLMAKFLFLHLTLGWVVYRDAASQERCALDVPPVLWGFMVLVSPIWGLLVYWLLHHSVLQRERRATAEEASAAQGLKLQGRSLSRSANGVGSGVATGSGQPMQEPSNGSGG